MWHTHMYALLVIVKRNTALLSCSKKAAAHTSHAIHPEPAGTVRLLPSQDHCGRGRRSSNLSNSLSINEKSPWHWLNDYVRSEKVDLKGSHLQRHSHQGKGLVVLVIVTQEGKRVGLPSLNRLLARCSSHLWTKNFPLETQRSVFFLVIRLILKKMKS